MLFSRRKTRKPGIWWQESLVHKPSYPLLRSTLWSAGNSCSVCCIFSQIVPASAPPALREIKEKKQTLLAEGGEGLGGSKNKLIIIKGKVIWGNSGLKICRYRCHGVTPTDLDHKCRSGWGFRTVLSLWGPVQTQAEQCTFYWCQICPDLRLGPLLAASLHSLTDFSLKANCSAGYSWHVSGSCWLGSF